MPKDDIRRNYPIMFLNALNSAELSFLTSFFHQFAMKKFSFTYNSSVALSNHFRQSCVALHGQYLSSLFITAFSQLSPDSIFQIHSFQIKQRSDISDIQIYCPYEVLGTKLYDYTAYQVGQGLIQHFPQDIEILQHHESMEEKVDKKLLVLKQRKAMELPTNEYYHPLETWHAKQVARRLTQPHSIVGKGYFLFDIAVNKRLKSIEMGLNVQK
jgi:hypothetical protein